MRLSRTYQTLPGEPAALMGSFLIRRLCMWAKNGFWILQTITEMVMTLSHGTMTGFPDTWTKNSMTWLRQMLLCSLMISGNQVSSLITVAFRSQQGRMALTPQSLDVRNNATWLSVVFYTLDKHGNRHGVDAYRSCGIIFTITISRNHYVTVPPKTAPMSHEFWPGGKTDFLKKT